MHSIKVITPLDFRTVDTLSRRVITQVITWFCSKKYTFRKDENIFTNLYNNADLLISITSYVIRRNPQHPNVL